MPSPIETIRSYMVSLGFSLDKPSYNRATKAVDEFGSGVEELAPKIVKTMGKAAVAFTSFGIAVAAGTAKFLNGLGNQEIQMEMLSRQLWTTQQRAQAFSFSLKALGANLQDLYLSPTLMQQYRELNSVANQMTTPGDYNAQIRSVQNLGLQFKEMKLEAYYALQWIGYYFTKYMAGPISHVTDMLSSINKVIVKNMPTWTKRVAEVMVSFEQAGIYTVQALKGIWNWLVKMANYIPGWAKIVAGALALISVSNPFTLVMEGIGAAILLLDDFKTYVSGGKSAFPALWAWVEKVGHAMKNLGIPQQFIKNMNDYAKAVGNSWRAFGNLVAAIGDLYAKINGQKGQGVISFAEMLGNTLNAAVQSATTLINMLSTLATGVSYLLKGDWKDASNIFGIFDGAPGVISKQLLEGKGNPTPKPTKPDKKVSLPTAHPGANGFSWSDSSRPRTSKRQQQQAKPKTRMAATPAHAVASSGSSTHPTYSYAYPQTIVNNNHSSSKTVHATLQVHQQINAGHGSMVGAVGRALEIEAVTKGRQLLAHFRGLG